MPKETLIASGPVIIENNEVLLIKEKKGNHITPWFFPGGKKDKKDKNLQETCIRESKEEIGVEIKILKKLKTVFEKKDNITLVHYLCERKGKIQPGPTIVELGWHDIYALPKDCANNIYEVIQDYLNT